MVGGVRNTSVALLNPYSLSFLLLHLSPLPQSLTRLWLVSPFPRWKHLGEEGAAALCEQEAGDRLLGGIQPPGMRIVTSWVEGDEFPGRNPALCVLLHSAGSVDEGKGIFWGRTHQNMGRSGWFIPFWLYDVEVQWHSHSKCFYLPSRNKSSAFAHRQSDDCAFYSKTHLMALR